MLTGLHRHTGQLATEGDLCFRTSRVANEEDIHWNADNVHDWEPPDGTLSNEQGAARTGVQTIACSASGVDAANLKLRWRVFSWQHSRVVYQL